MSGTIKVQSEELKNVAGRMQSIKNDYDVTFTKVISDINNTNNAWSEAVANNFSQKIASVKKSLKAIDEDLDIGIQILTMSATSYEEMDKALANAIRGQSGKNNGGGNASAGNAPSATSQRKYERVMYDATQDYPPGNDPRGTDKGGSCMVSSYAMLLTALGRPTTPGEVYQWNGSSGNYCTHNYSAYGVDCSGPRSDGLSWGDAQGNEQRIRQILSEHPEGIMIGSYPTNAGHCVYAYLSDDGRILINDPSGYKPDEGITVDQSVFLSKNGGWAGINRYWTASLK